MASGLKKITNGDFTRGVFSEEDGAQTQKRLLAGRDRAWMIYFFMISDTNESVLDQNEILKVELKEENVEFFSMILSLPCTKTR